MSEFIRSSPLLRNALYGEERDEPHPWTPPKDEILYPTPSRSRWMAPATRSTCLDLLPWPSVVWDVNGYYRALGVHFRADRKELKAAYQRRGGPDDVYLTYVFQQLLNPKVRRAYDACPLGTIFFDKLVSDRLKRKAQVRATVMNRYGETTTAKEVLEDWGYVLDEEAPNEEGELDTPRPVVQSDAWPYGYYLWKVKSSDARDPLLVEKMRRWQEAIVEQCEGQALVLNFGVGLMGRQKYGARTATMSVDGATIIFVAADAMSDLDAVAAVAVKRLTRD